MNENKTNVARRALLIAALTLPAGACTTTGPFQTQAQAPQHPNTLSPMAIAGTLMSIKAATMPLSQTIARR